jgi:hypothetical protein
MATKTQDTKGNPFKAIPITVTEKCDQCPLRDNSGTVCWQGSPHCIIHGDNIVVGSPFAKGIQDYKVAMQKAAQHDNAKQDNADAIVKWQLESGSLKNNFLVKSILKLFS